MPHRKELVRYINLKLASLGQPTCIRASDAYYLELAGPLLRSFQQKDRLLADRLCPVDSRIQAFLDAYLAGCSQEAPHLPANTFTLDQPHLAREMSLPEDGDTFVSPYVHSYRVLQGVLHNPSSDRRTTKGVFHVVEGGLPIPDDKQAVPKQVFAALLAAALAPPLELLTLPFTANQNDPARLFVSLLLRPLVCPATGPDPEKTMELRFFAPASLVSNLDFVEGIFGNAGDPFLPENDAALDPMHWTGHTGCVVLAPHLAGLKKRDLGLPRFADATERQRRDGMCWRDDDELYNDGNAFKASCRDERGVMVTIIADNYFGYCKKEVKTQISYAANLYGMCEEEHAGGAIAFASYVLGQDFYGGRTVELNDTSYEQAVALLANDVECMPEGYGIDRNYPDIFYVPADAEFALRGETVEWRRDGSASRLTLRAGAEYILPSGYRVRLEKQAGGTHWRLIGTRADSTLCHKPSTVSGGGKSEISKSISNAILKGPIFVKDYRRDTEYVDQILKLDFTSIYREPPDARAKRPLLSPERSLGSVIKLLTPSPDYKDEYNAWLRDLPQTIRQFVCVLKRYYRPEWGDEWRRHLTVDRVNGFPGHELKLDNENLTGNYLRVGFDTDGSWRIFKLRPDFHPAEKVQVEDDITASVVVPAETLEHLDPQYQNPSVKLVQNCEALLFQRPDDAIHRGFDKQAEADIAGPGVFLSNFEPLSVDQARAIVDHVVDFDRFTEPMKRVLEKAAYEPETEWVVSSAHPRVVDGKPSRNPRYLQRRPDLANPRLSYLANVSSRLYREAPRSKPLHFPVNAVLAGRRGNPSEPGVPPLAAYSPIHYQEVPELFMDFICSLTGKSPSTTGFGTEGALTKRPFNALLPVIDVNNALVAAILTGYAGFTSAAGWVGPSYRIDHDISMLVPELWCRMTVAERDPAFLIENGYLEKLEDFEYEGKPVLAGRLGYRITSLFVDRFLGRIFETPDTVLPEEFLRPETQNPAMFAAGVEAIVEAQKRVALEYFQDGSVEAACPPVKALLHIMAHGAFEGMGISDPRLRSMFTRDSL
ncbi:MAG TPA: hypothetical protein VN428_17820, partial [Bryobacteraceae bacterium]|nr:hypothetical protein [Bryobacteraceae bacterium]